MKEERFSIDELTPFWPVEILVIMAESYPSHGLPGGFGGQE